MTPGHPSASVPIRIGVAFPADPTSPDSWSGTPAGICRGLASQGVDVRPVDLHLPAVVELAVTTALGVRLGSRSRARLLPEVAALRSAVARWRLRDGDRLDGVVQIGTGFSMPARLRIVTVEDMTVHQAYGLYPDWRRLPDRAVARRIELQARAYEAAHACCALTSWAARSIVRDYGVPTHKVHVVGVGRNLSLPTTDRKWASPRFLFVGRDWRRKNGPMVLRAFERLRREMPQARLDVVGGHPPIAAPGVTGHGILQPADPAHRSRLEALFAAATCLVMPSWVEPAGIVYAEAASAGLPSIGTTEGGASDIIGDAGRLVHPADEDGLLEALRALADPQVACRLGQVAQQRAQLFSWSKVAGRLLGALDVPPLAKAWAKPLPMA
jgi:glycogen synthase